MLPNVSPQNSELRVDLAIPGWSPPVRQEKSELSPRDGRKCRQQGSIAEDPVQETRRPPKDRAGVTAMCLEAAQHVGSGQNLPFDRIHRWQWTHERRGRLRNHGFDPVAPLHGEKIRQFVCRCNFRDLVSANSRSAKSNRYCPPVPVRKLQHHGTLQAAPDSTSFWLNCRSGDPHRTGCHTRPVWWSCGQVEGFAQRYPPDKPDNLRLSPPISPCFTPSLPTGSLLHTVRPGESDAAPSR